ncbi:hypothetical protein Pla86_31370 [Planctomycetes bacterium Pla86]|uniref:Uncharacterized protein n=1 Tax=Engelhardtia mirabilis TaxID=2528011 RepID=A0A518BM80_9BACT|nr:hypothetical protein Pla133_31380 [Planctomycetes bacterium Pla133]QDV02372.1 hypothetical protein Pla86_31370 [Planctomycetes bacterium Pla86]
MARARPFVLERCDRFRSPPPPAIDSEAYPRAFDEVSQLGRFESATRSADQSHLARWWKDFVENSHNRLARRQVTEEDLDLWEATRLFALLEMAVYDACVNAFENKISYNHWRPYAAIRWAEHDGNPDTLAEPDWSNTHRYTYAFPSYPLPMVRPDANSLPVPRRGTGEGWLAGRDELAGGSPALVVAGEPGSRLRASGEIPPSERSVESPTVGVGLPCGEQGCGPSHKRTLQPRERSPRKGGVGRAGHVTAKATDCAQESGAAQDTPGVRRRARSDSSSRNRRDPNRRLTSSAGDAYERNAKWCRAGRESEGLVVLLTPGESRDEGRGPALVMLVFAGTGEGMP